MLKAFINIWRIPELRTKLLFTIFALMLYRLGFAIPLPGIDQASLSAAAEQASKSGGAGLAEYMSLFSGGTLSQSSIFGLGIMPYISAAIIFQLLGTVHPGLRKLQEEGAAGYQKIQEYTRYTTVFLCLIQAIMMLNHFSAQPADGANSIVYPELHGTIIFWLSGVVGLSAGTIFLMWLGEQVDRYGIGNGVSLIITGGILARMPWAISQIAADFSMSGEKTYGISTAVMLVIVFVVVVAGAVIITQGQRRIPIQQAKHNRGRRVFGGQKTFLPLRVNHGGVMPIIFASSLMMFPGVITKWFDSTYPNTFWNTVNGWFDPTSLTYIIIYIMMIFFFSFFWTTVQFNPEKVSKQLRDSGSFVPGLRPGPRTADYLENVMGRITYAGAGFLALIAIVPTIVMTITGIPYAVSAFLGGTGLLITVSVMLDFVQRIEAGLLMRNYDGFLGDGNKIRS